MARISICVLVAAVIVFAPCSAQERPYSISVYGSFTSSSKLFHHANDPDEFIRNEYYPIDAILGAGIDIRRSIPSIGIQFGLSIDYLSKTEKFDLPVSASKSIPSSDGFTAIPVELSGYFTIPVGDENFELYMGGGAGFYFGHRRYAIAGAEAKVVAQSFKAGIHVVSGLQYAVLPTVSLRSEIKFRSVQFETTNKFQQTSVRYGTGVVALPQQPIVSRININGMMLTLGLVYHL